MADDTLRRVAVIMAGGGGERFWPLSREERPKQLLPFGKDGKTLLADTLERIAPLFARKDVYIATSAALRPVLIDAGLDLPHENILAEPCRRNTAGCLLHVAAHLSARRKGDYTMAVLAADHRIDDRTAFIAAASAALQAAEARPVLVTLGIRPTRPETGYGYIEVESPPRGLRAVPVQRFYEKPIRATAEEYVATGRFFWNSGMFFWRGSTFMAELSAARPEMVQSARAMGEAIAKGDMTRADELFEGLQAVSIDYALLEHSRRIEMVPADFPWDDIGAWDALSRLYPAGEAGNVAHGSATFINAENCIVWNELDPGRTPVAVVGARDLVVVATDEGILIVPKEHAQEVREAARRLKNEAED